MLELTLGNLVLELEQRLELVLGGPSLGEGHAVLGVLQEPKGTVSHQAVAAARELTEVLQQRTEYLPSRSPAMAAVLELRTPATLKRTC